MAGACAAAGEEAAGSASAAQLDEAEEQLLLLEQRLGSPPDEPLSPLLESARDASLELLEQLSESTNLQQARHAADRLPPTHTAPDESHLEHGSRVHPLGRQSACRLQVCETIERAIERVLGCSRCTVLLLHKDEALQIWSESPSPEVLPPRLSLSFAAAYEQYCAVSQLQLEAKRRERSEQNGATSAKRRERSDQSEATCVKRRERAPQSPWAKGSPQSQ